MDAASYNAFFAVESNTPIHKILGSRTGIIAIAVLDLEV